MDWEAIPCVVPFSFFFFSYVCLVSTLCMSTVWESYHPTEVKFHVCVHTWPLKLILILPVASDRCIISTTPWRWRRPRTQPMERRRSMKGGWMFSGRAGTHCYSHNRVTVLMQTPADSPRHTALVIQCCAQIWFGGNRVRGVYYSLPKIQHWFLPLIFLLNW